MIKQYYVFPDSQTAEVANQAISVAMGCPIIGINAANGLPDPKAQMTIQWATPQQTDAKAKTFPAQWVIPVPYDLSFVSASGQQSYIPAPYDPSWFPVPPPNNNAGASGNAASNGNPDGNPNGGVISNGV